MPTAVDREGLEAKRDTRPNASRIRPGQKASTGSITDEATIAFVKRTLCSQQTRPGNSGDDGKGAVLNRPLTDLLPPLTSSNDVDLQLYALISIIIKDFVQSWYSKITPDHEFVDEVVRIIAHCTRGLEERLRHVDLQTLVLDELPALVDSHVQSYRHAHANISLYSQADTPHQVYHANHPHPALSPVPLGSLPNAVLEQSVNEATWRQLIVQGVLSLLLPPEDLTNPTLRVLMSEIFAEMIIGNTIAGKICEGWFVWETVAKVIDVLSTSKRPAVSTSISPTIPQGRLEQFGLLENVKQRGTSIRTPRVGHAERLLQTFWQIIQAIVTVVTILRMLVSALVNAATLPPRLHTSTTEYHVPEKQPLNDLQTTSLDEVQQQLDFPEERAVLNMAAWTMPLTLLSIDVRMPWLTGLVSLLQHLLICGPGMVGSTDSRLDRLLSHTIRSRLLDPSLLPAILLSVRTSLFPNNSLAPGRPPPSTADEIQAIKLRCADTVIDSLPAYVRDVYFGTSNSNTASTTSTPVTPVAATETTANTTNTMNGGSGNGSGAPSDDAGRRKEMRRQVFALLDVFGDAYLNKHLVFAVLELVICRLFPELEKQTIEEILTEKLGMEGEDLSI